MYLVLKIRKAALAKGDALAHASSKYASAEELHDFGELPGLVCQCAVPYVTLPTTWSLVLPVEDELR